MTIASTPREILQRKAHNAVAAAIKNGRLPNLNTCHIRCKDCGARATCYEHRDYNKPLEVSAVCDKCDNKRGAALPPISNADGNGRKITWFDKGKKRGWGTATLGGGEGWTPLQLVCHVPVPENGDWQFHGAPKTLCAAQRSEYFKGHDPWHL